MAEGRKRRRGRRRGRREGHPPPGAGREAGGAPEIREESEAPGVLPPRLSLWRGRRRRPDGRPSGRKQKAPGVPVKERTAKRPRAERAAGAAVPGDASPLGFWRRERLRSYRAEPAAQHTWGRTWQRIRGMYFPPWLPVAVVIAVVFGILGSLFFFRGAAGAPRIGDHWHASYTIFIGDKRQPNIPTFTGPEEIHTHGDGIIHMHPFIPAGEGRGAALDRFFQYGGGKLSSDEMQIPGDPKVYSNGDPVPDDGRPGVIRILRADSGIHPLGGGFNQAITACNGKPESEFEEISPRYIPQDGDCIRIVFGPPGVEPIVQADRTIIPAEQATRTIDVEVTGSEGTTAFSPASPELNVGETVKIALKNNSEVLHGLRFAGADGQYDTSDDYVTEPPTIEPGAAGEAIVRFDSPGESQFRDEVFKEVTGKIVVKEAVPTPTPEGSPQPEAVDVTLDVAAADDSFAPNQIEVGAGQRFRLNLRNEGSVLHNIRISGPDGKYRTDDDLVSTDVRRGETGELVGKIDQPGTYEFRCDFHPTQHTGAITVR